MRDVLKKDTMLEASFGSVHGERWVEMERKIGSSRAFTIERKQDRAPP